MFSKLTANSGVFLGLTAFSVAAAVYFRNPLLVYTAIFLVTANIVLYAWAQYSVHGLTIKRSHPRLGVATKALPVKLELTNDRSTARYGILGFDMHSQLTPKQEYSPVAFLQAPAGRATAPSYEITPPRRGLFRIGPFYLYGGDPFGFYKCWRKFDEYTQVTVLPHPVTLNYRNPSSTSNLAQDELETVPLSGESTEFLGVREYATGDPMKRIHWPSTARLGRLVSRQFERNVASAVSSLLLADSHMLRGGLVDNPLEASITMIASLANATCTERFNFSSLVVSGSEYDYHSGSGSKFYQELAVSLAQLKGGGQADWTQWNKYILNFLPRDSSLVVFTADYNEDLHQRLGKLAVNFRRMVAIVFDTQSFIKLQRAVTPGPRISVGSGFLVLQVSYGDNLARVLEQALSKAPMLEAVR
jgi:uncharacterized protein (DUF58 family)